MLPRRLEGPTGNYGTWRRLERSGAKVREARSARRPEAQRSDGEPESAAGVVKNMGGCKGVKPLTRVQNRNPTSSGQIEPSIGIDDNNALLKKPPLDSLHITSMDTHQRPCDSVAMVFTEDPSWTNPFKKIGFPR